MLSEETHPSRKCLIPCLLVFTSACAAGPGPSAPHAGSSIVRDDWRPLSWEERHDAMTFRVLPNMAREFQHSQRKAAPDMTCRTCHGEDAERVAYAMPHGLPALDLTRLDRSEPMVRFMTDQVTPTMADLLGVDRRQFTCFGLPPEAAMMTRRDLLSSAAGVALASGTRRAWGEVESPMPVAFVSHGGQCWRSTPCGPALRGLGSAHPEASRGGGDDPALGFPPRRMALGATGRGVAQYDFPSWLATKLPAGLAYASPPSEVLAERVASLLGGRVERGARRGFDHTTWMPLLHLLPAADVPVLEIAFPYLPDRDLFGLGSRLAPLRDEGVLLLASGGMTHNLASVDLDAPPQRLRRGERLGTSTGCRTPGGSRYRRATRLETQGAGCRSRAPGRRRPLPRPSHGARRSVRAR